MIKHYLLTALRHLKKAKGFSAINIAGFAVGIACCIMLALYVRTELGYDRHHEQVDRIFRLCVRGKTGNDEFVWGASNAVAAKALRDDYPEVAATARIGDVPSSSVQLGDRIFFEDRFLYADDSVFDIFSWRWRLGNRTDAWTSFFLDESLARRLSGMEQSRNIFSAFSYLAVLISSLGLLGMSAYTTEQRTREVGIRKILGCSSLNILILLGRDLLRHILVASAVSLPLAWIVGGLWLRGFPYRAGITVLSFVLPVGLVLAVGLATISFHVLRTAWSDPVRSLR